MASDNNNFEAVLFKTADKLRKNIDAAEYKNVVLGLIFLKYISDSFQEIYERLEQDEYSDPEDRDEYIAENGFFVPETARWKNLQAKAKFPGIGIALDAAMAAIEKENPELKNVLPLVYGKPNLDKTSLGQLIDVISDIELKGAPRPPEGGETVKSPSGDLGASDLLGRVYEYFLGEFANAEGKKGGQFYTPKSIVKLIVEMIEPYKGRVYDPACGSGGMFVMSEKFVEEHQGNIQDITIYGQESNQTTWKLSKMNLAIRNINSQFVAWNTEGTFLKDMNPDLKADFILANPPFNQSEWGQDILQEDGRWKYGIPPAGNANFAWMQHMLYHLAPSVDGKSGGVMATVLANGSLSSNTSGEGEIRKNIVQADLVDCIIALPKQLFYNTGIPATIWILRRSPHSLKGRGVRSGETLFIDASDMGFMKDRVHREFASEDIETIEQTYHSWRAPRPPEGGDNVQSPLGNLGALYEDVKGFCKSASLTDIEKHSFVLTPGRYVGIPDEEDDLPTPRSNAYYVYAIKCDNDSIYIGQTHDLKKHWQEHVSGKGADWTKSHKPKYIIHHEVFPTREEAVAREKELKTTNGRRWLKQAIAEGRARQAGGIPFEDKMKDLTTTLAAQMQKEKELDGQIKTQLAKIGFEL
ncbi:MAG: N-6 DNA methylase [Gallionella sp.]